MIIRILFFIVAFIVSYTSLTHAAGFDCSKASTAVERMIYADPKISKLILVSAVTSGAMPENAVNQKEILSAHNRYRMELKILPLVWSNTLAAHAQDWANHLAQSGKNIYHSRASGEGENLWQGTSGFFSYTQMVESWGKEKKYFKNGKFPNVSKSGNWQDVGHYTQIVWRGTAEVGCGKSTSGEYDIFVCRYSPPGNYVGEKVY